MRKALLAIMIMALLSATAVAGVPGLINYQGRLADHGGTPVNGALSMTFSIYNTPTGDIHLWREIQIVTVTDGVFSIALGNVTAIDLPFDEQYYLGVAVGEDAEMTPRAVLQSVPYAMRAGTADTAVTAQTATNVDTAATLGGKNVSELVSLLDGRYGNLGTSLVADFSVSPATIYTNQSASFIDQTHGVPVSWNWDFGDSSSSTLQNPPHTYAAPGDYGVTLTARDSLTSSTKSATITVSEIDADFTATKTIIAVNNSTTFIDQTQGVPISWNWDFGDTGTSTLQNPTHTYTSPGYYTVSLTTGDGVTSNTETKVGYIIAALPGTITTVDTAGMVGQFTSIAVDSKNLPVISYLDATNYDLKVLRCQTPSCSGVVNATTVDSTGDVGRYSSIAIGTDKLPIISYYSTTGADLKVVHCGNEYCTSGNIINTVDSAGSVGMYTSIAIGSDGLPVISYYDALNKRAKVAHCGDELCTPAQITINTISSTSSMGMYTSIAIGADNWPVISSYSEVSNVPKVTHCEDAFCSVSTTYVVDSPADKGMHTSIAIGADDLPVVSYLDYTNRNLKVVHCGDEICYPSTNTKTTVDSTVWFSSIAIGTDGLPVISYEAGAALKVVHCGNAACSSGNLKTIVDSTVGPNNDPSIAVGPDGLPVIAYFDNTNDDLKVAKCGDAACLVWP